MAKLLKILKDNKDAIIKPIVVLFAICIVIPLALSITNKITVERIAELEAQNEKNAMSQLIKAENFEEKKEPFGYYIAKNGEETLGYIFVTASKGYGGEVSVMTAVNTDGTVKSIAILDASNETPGLGQNVTKENFYSQYSGKTNGVSIVKSGAVGENNEVNAVTGATISSTAVTNAVNEALDNYKKVAAETSILSESEVKADEK